MQKVENAFAKSSMGMAKVIKKNETGLKGWDLLRAKVT
jgi:hypothetical protein